MTTLPLARLGRRHRLFWRRGRRRGGRRYCEREPHVPAVRAVRRVKFLVAFQIQISLKIAHRDDVTDLRTSPEYPRLKTAEPIARPGVTGDLLVGISDDAELQLVWSQSATRPNRGACQGRSDIACGHSRNCR
jgi:hypothetical protein